MKKTVALVLSLISTCGTLLCPVVVSTPMDRAIQAKNTAIASGTLGNYISAITTIETELGDSIGNRNLTLLALDAAAQKSTKMNYSEKTQIQIRIQDTMLIGQSDSQRQLLSEVIEGLKAPITEERNALAIELDEKKTQIDQLNQQTTQLVQARLHDEQGIQLLQDCKN